MSIALVAALVLTVVLLVITAYFFMGSLPLLVLKHDTPMDSRFVRGFFNTYYLAVMFTAAAAALSYALAGRLAFAAAVASLVLLAVVLRRAFMSRMDMLRIAIQSSDPNAIRGFRRMHVTAILANLAQLVTVVSSLIVVSLQMK